MSADAPPELDWRPLLTGGAVFRTHRPEWIESEGQRVELRFVPSGGAKLLITVVVLTGVFAMVSAMIYAFRYDEGPAIVVGALLSSALLVLGSFLSHQLIRPQCFSKERFVAPRSGENLAIAEVVGLQITRKVVIGPEDNYDADELNLVLTDGRRVNVLNHGDLATLRSDAELLAQWLERPLWIRPDLQH